MGCKKRKSLSTIATMTLEKVMNAPLTQEEILNIRQAATKVRAKQTEYALECPKQTKKDGNSYKS